MASPELTLFFDLDGTILDVSDRHHRIYSRVATAFGGTPIDKAEYWRLKQERLLWPEMLAKTGIATSQLDPFMDMFIAEIEKPEELAQDQPIAGTPETLRGLHEQGFSMYLVSLRRGHQKFLHQLAALGLDSYFTETITGHTDGPTDELKARLIAERLGEGKGLMVGDTEADVLAAKRLGMIAVAVTSGIRSSEFLQALEPDYVLDDITQLPGVIAKL